MPICEDGSVLDLSIYDKDVNPFPSRQQNDAIVNLFKAHGYQHHGFTTQYDTSSQVRWMVYWT